MDLKYILYIVILFIIIRLLSKRESYNDNDYLIYSNQSHSRANGSSSNQDIFLGLKSQSNFTKSKHKYLKQVRFLPMTITALTSQIDQL